MIIHSLRVQNFRSHGDKTVILSPNVTVITGANGSGKTSLLEAIYVGLQGKSFKGTDREILTDTSQWYRIDLDTRVIKYESTKQSRPKQFVVENTSFARLPAKHKYPAILFEPDDLRLISGSPERRRDFIDRFIATIDPLYSTNLSKYKRSLKQRNSLLKNKFSKPSDFFAWDVAIAEYGAYIIERRVQFIEELNRSINQVYDDIAKSHDDISVHYSRTLIGFSKQKLLNDLSANFERDKILGSTSVGPHRDDIIFDFNGSPANKVASRGENRSIVLALKFLEVQIIEQLTGLKPVVLLDDVFSELDEIRQQALRELTRDHQVIMTSTHVLPTGDKFKQIKL